MNKMLRVIFGLLLTTLVNVSLQGCLHKHEESDQDPTDSPVTEPETTTARHVKNALMKVNVSAEGIHSILSIDNIPADSILECTLDNETTFICHPDMQLDDASEGTHTLIVKAQRDGEVIAIGEANFKINRFGVLVTELPTASNLALNVKFEDGLDDRQLRSIAKDLKIKIELDQAPKCDVVIICRFGDDKASERRCGSKSSDLIPAIIQNLGLNQWSAYAKCGDVVGPSANLTWKAVDDGHQEFALIHLKDTSDRHIFPIANPSECSELLLDFECKSTGQTAFQKCANLNVLDSPKSGSQIRATCDGKVGPAITL